GDRSDYPLRSGRLRGVGNARPCLATTRTCGSFWKEEAMKRYVTTLIATSIIACVVVPASANAYSHKHHKKHIQYHYVPKHSPNPYGSVQDPQVEYDSKKVPFGTQLWWQQFERERGGSSGGDSEGGGGR